MAQVVDYYTATAGGNSCMYYYQYPDKSSTATRIYTGTVIGFAANYVERGTNGMYPMSNPPGWIDWYHVQNVKAVYRTVADPCTAPTKLMLNTEEKTLAIIGGDGGDLNAWTGFGISCRERAINSTLWGEWSEDTVAADRSVSVSVDSGMVRQFRVRTLGEAGADYYSDYVVCETLLNGNTAAGTPVVLFPLSGMETTAPVPVLKIDCPPEPDGDNMTLQRSLNGGAWTDAASLKGDGGVVYDPLPVEEGTHTVRYRLMDANGETSGEDSISFVRTSKSWARSIRTGDVIATREISFVKDILELLERVNSVRAFYGMSAIILPGTPGRVGDWQSQLEAMQNAVNECRTAMALPDESFDSPSAWPQAAQINQLRTILENT